MNIYVSRHWVLALLLSLSTSLLVSGKLQANCYYPEVNRDRFGTIPLNSTLTQRQQTGLLLGIGYQGDVAAFCSYDCQNDGERTVYSRDDGVRYYCTAPLTCLGCAEFGSHIGETLPLPLDPLSIFSQTYRSSLLNMTPYDLVGCLSGNSRSRFNNPIRSLVVQATPQTPDFEAWYLQAKPGFSYQWQDLTPAEHSHFTDIIHQNNEQNQTVLSFLCHGRTTEELLQPSRESGNFGRPVYRIGQYIEHFPESQETCSYTQKCLIGDDSRLFVVNDPDTKSFLTATAQEPSFNLLNVEPEQYFDSQLKGAWIDSARLAIGSGGGSEITAIEDSPFSLCIPYDNAVTQENFSFSIGTVLTENYSGVEDYSGGCAYGNALNQPRSTSFYKRLDIPSSAGWLTLTAQSLYLEAGSNGHFEIINNINAVQVSIDINSKPLFACRELAGNNNGDQLRTGKVIFRNNEPLCTVFNFNNNEPEIQQLSNFQVLIWNAQPSLTSTSEEFSSPIDDSVTGSSAIARQTSPIFILITALLVTMARQY